MRIFRRIGLVAAFVAVLVGGWMFAEGNDAPVRIDYLFGETPDVVLWKALAAVAAIGAVAPLLVMSFWLFVARLEVRRLRKALRELETEVHQLRNLPAVSDDPVEVPATAAVAAGGAIHTD
jgi:uncharacterized membrane protein YciS (DUF1049 family)